MENIPTLNPEATKTLHFSIAKDFSDGALKSSILQELRSFFDIEVFVESGTYMGNTTRVASQIFREAHSVELFPEFYSRAVERFKNDSNITLYLGNSGAILPEIISHCRGRILFYLDGHFDGGSSGKGVTNTPILEELAAIKMGQKGDSLILIDDISDFQDSLYPQEIQNTCFEGYPDLKQLIEELLEINSRYQFCFLGNALLAFPPSSDVTVSSVASACVIDLFSTIAELFSEETLLEAEKTIAQASGMEEAALATYYEVYAPFEWSHGWRSFAAFWYALMLQNRGNQFEASQILRSTATHSLAGWRVDR